MSTLKDKIGVYTITKTLTEKDGTLYCVCCWKSYKTLKRITFGVGEKASNQDVYFTGVGHTMIQLCVKCRRLLRKAMSKRNGICKRS